MALEDGSRYCGSPAAASVSPRELLPNSPSSCSRNSSTASSPATVCMFNLLIFSVDVIIIFSHLFKHQVDITLTSKREIVTEDEETDINVEDDYPYNKITFGTNTESMSKFSFSITNILSDNFGPKPVKIEQSQSIFRPFDSVNSKSYVQNSSSIFLSNFRLSEIFDKSTKYASTQNKSDSNLRKSFFNTLTSYPKIHEEILNNHKKNPNTQQASNFLSTSSSKIPPLGGLCKTISQIGRENVTHSTLSSAPLTQSKNSSSYSRKVQQSSDIDDSDDCTSEASTNKDESQKMWPAWVSLSHDCALEIDLLCFSLFLFFNRFSALDTQIGRVLVSFTEMKNKS